MMFECVRSAGRGRSCSLCSHSRLCSQRSLIARACNGLAGEITRFSFQLLLVQLMAALCLLSVASVVGEPCALNCQDMLALICARLSLLRPREWFRSDFNVVCDPAFSYDARLRARSVP